MSSLASLPGSSLCWRCIRTTTSSTANSWLVASRQQVRGKKKLAKIATVNVRLLEDIPRYGRQGAIIPIAAGRMRNEFYPKKKAEYVTATQLRSLGLQNGSLERDSTFGIAQQMFSEKPQEQSSQGAAIPITLDIIKPEQASKVVSTILPPTIKFYRSPIAPAQPAPRHSPSIPASSALSAAAQEVVASKTPEKIPIYGSVTTADVAENVRAVLAEDAQGARVVIAPEDITFIGEGEEKERVKHLGAFDIEIRIKGAGDAIRRTVRVEAQE